MKTLKILFFLFALTAFLTGCNKSPMDKLKSDKKYPELESTWRTECKNKTELWKEAVAYCKTHKGKPNCGDVNFIYDLDSSSQKVTGILNSHPIDSSF